MLILNIGGTFNKRYNMITGELEVPYDNEAVGYILSSATEDFNPAGTVYKDSLQMDSEDRKMIARIIMESSDDTFVLIHGTDTMSVTAEFLDEIFDDRKIILTGAMKPFEIEQSEASFNLGMAIGFAKAKPQNGVYICMSGYVAPWQEIEKNRSAGKFQIVR